jgi:hypothetical protein
MTHEELASLITVTFSCFRLEQFSTIEIKYKPQMWATYII